jgi:hypothetical protein
MYHYASMFRHRREIVDREIATKLFAFPLEACIRYKMSQGNFKQTPRCINCSWEGDKGSCCQAWVGNMPARRLGCRLLPLPDPAVHACTPDDYRRDVTSPTPRTGVEVCRDAGCPGAVVDTPHTETGHHRTLRSRQRSEQGCAAKTGSASGHSLQHVLDNAL